MKYDSHLHHRRSIRLAGYDYGRAGVYFVTICTEHRVHLFGEMQDETMKRNAAGAMIEQQWLQLPLRYGFLTLSDYVVMPNHFHGLLLLQRQDAAAQRVTVGDIVGAFKSLTDKMYRAHMARLNWAPIEKRMWQRNYYEHIVSSESSYEATRAYIRDNPAHWAQDSENQL